LVLGGHEMKNILKLRNKSISISRIPKQPSIIKAHPKCALVMEINGARMAQCLTEEKILLEKGSFVELRI
jgi:hypothetical protein